MNEIKTPRAQNPARYLVRSSPFPSCKEEQSTTIQAPEIIEQIVCFIRFFSTRPKNVSLKYFQTI